MSSEVFPESPDQTNRKSEMDKLRTKTKSENIIINNDEKVLLVSKFCKIEINAREISKTLLFENRGKACEKKIQLLEDHLEFLNSANVKRDLANFEEKRKKLSQWLTSLRDTAEYIHSSIGSTNTSSLPFENYAKHLSFKDFHKSEICTICDDCSWINCQCNSESNHLLEIQMDSEIFPECPGQINRKSEMDKSWEKMMSENFIINNEEKVENDEGKILKVNYDMDKTSSNNMNENKFQEKIKLKSEYKQRKLNLNSERRRSETRSSEKRKKVKLHLQSKPDQKPFPIEEKRAWDVNEEKPGKGPCIGFSTPDKWGNIRKKIIFRLKWWGSERRIKLHLNGDRDQEPAPLTVKSQWDAPPKLPGKGHRHGCSTPARRKRLQGLEIGFQNHFETLIEYEVPVSADNEQTRVKMDSYHINDKAKKEKKSKRGNKVKKGSKPIVDQGWISSTCSTKPSEPPHPLSKKV